MKLYYNGELQTKGWVRISDGILYIKRNVSRSYWILKHLNKQPKITFNENTKTIKIGLNKIVFTSLTEFKKAYNKHSKRK